MNLVLDEKKLRKGKPVGLPYVGSKKKISKKIVEIIKQNFGTDKTVYDVFGGGGAITAELMINGINVVYNDFDKTVTDMFNRVLSQDREWIKTLIISRDEFYTIRDKKIKTVDEELKLLVNSFGNNRKEYLYSKNNSDAKYSLAVEIINNEDVFNGYKKTATYKNKADLHQEKLGFQGKKDKHRILQQLGRLQQLERLQHLGRLDLLTTQNKDYRDYTGLKNAILYLDPPYENAENSYKTRNFDSVALYDWAYKMSKDNIVIVSSYEVSDERFEKVFEFKNVRSTLAGGNTGNVTEKLFMVKAGL